MREKKLFLLRLIKKRNDRSLLAFILVINIFISLLFLRGRIDQDFFSFYYIGRGVSQGLDMYRDFAHNKGPVLYLFFGFLNYIFKSNYRLAIVLSSSLLDTISVYFLFKLFGSWFNFRLTDNPYKRLAIVGLVVLYLKSFSIGSFMGGVYSETLAFALLVPSLYLAEKKTFSSGILFALSVLSRPTFLFFLLVYVVRLYIKKRNLHQIFKFALGFLLPISLFVLIYAVNGNLNYVLSNVYSFNFNYAQTVGGLYWPHLIRTTSIGLRMLFSLLITFLFVFYYIFFGRVPKERKLFVFTLLIASLGATFVGGLFYFHHFIQYSLVLFTTIILVIKSKGLFKSPFAIYIVTGPLVAALILNYFFFVFTKPVDAGFQSFIKEKHITNSNKEYLMIIPFYPKLYIDFNKSSPDRYYSVFYLSDYYNKDRDFDRNLHETINKEKLRNTLFLFVKTKPGDEWLIKEYKMNFVEIFKLKYVDSYSDETLEAEIYESAI